MNVRESYDAAATAYADHLGDELTHKPLDRHLLNRFAEATRGHGTVADFGCGPGQVARYLHDQGVTTVGMDFSPAMVRVATELHPGIPFSVDDMRQPSFPDASLAGIVSFYSIVHFTLAELGAIFTQMRRVLEPGGLALVAFHIGDQVNRIENLFGVPVILDFRFHVPSDIIATLHSANFSVIEQVVREPYAEVEYPSRRCYLLIRAD